MKHENYKIKKNDRVMVITGKDRGKIGKVLRMVSKRDRVVVERVNVIKRHTKPTQTAPQGGIIEKEAPIHVSNLMLVCGKCGDAVRVGRKSLEDGKRVRFCKKCGEVLD